MSLKTPNGANGDSLEASTFNPSIQYIHSGSEAGGSALVGCNKADCDADT